MKIHTKTLICCFSLCFFLSVYASNKGLTVEMKRNYCEFNGILKDEARCNEEFKMLEEPSDHPNFEKCLTC